MEMASTENFILRPRSKYFFSSFWPAVLLALAIVFFPSFGIGRLPGGKVIEIRVEDILLVLLGLIWFMNFLISKRKSFVRPPLFFPIVAWLGVVTVSTLTNLVFGNIEVAGGFFYLLKEIEFFLLYFYFFYHIRTFVSARIFLNVLIGAATVHVGWILYQVVSGLKITYYYSYTTFIEPEGPLIGGGLLLLIVAIALNVFLHHSVGSKALSPKKIVLLCAIVSPVLAIWTSESRVTFVAFLAVLFVTLLLYSFKQRLLMIVTIAVLGFVIISVAYLAWQLGSGILSGTQLNDTAPRLFNIQGFFYEINPENSLSRLSIWLRQVSELTKRPEHLFFGYGKSTHLGGEESHNYYLQVVSDAGIVGLLTFLFLIFSIMKISLQGFFRGGDSFVRGLCGGLFAATMAMLVLSISSEAFQLVKLSEVYWMLVALTMAALYFRKNEQIKQHI